MTAAGPGGPAKAQGAVDPGPDELNLRILQLLQRNARLTIAELARHVDRSESTVRERVAALEAKGYLRGYQALLDLGLLGFEAVGIVRARAAHNHIDEIAADWLAPIPEVISAHFLTGERPVYIKLMARDTKDLQRVVSERIMPLDLQDISVDVSVRTLVPERPPELVRLSPKQREPAT